MTGALKSPHHQSLPSENFMIYICLVVGETLVHMYTANFFRVGNASSHNLKFAEHRAKFHKRLYRCDNHDGPLSGQFRIISCLWCSKPEMSIVFQLVGCLYAQIWPHKMASDHIKATSNPLHSCFPLWAIFYTQNLLYHISFPADMVRTFTDHSPR